MPQQKELLMSELLDFYSSLLTDKQRETLDMYYNLDYSLAEIAENTGTSRQAALDSLKRGEAHLRQLEHQLGLRSAFHKTYDAIYVIEGLIARGVHTGELLYAADILRSIWED